MHPIQYDITVKSQQLEIEHALRKKPPYEVAMQIEMARSSSPRRINVLLGRLAGLLSPAKTRRAPAD
jgi:hypothetical protein